jgi:hypothetical protein
MLALDLPDAGLAGVLAWYSIKEGRLSMIALKGFSQRPGHRQRARVQRRTAGPDGRDVSPQISGRHDRDAADRRRSARRGHAVGRDEIVAVLPPGNPLGGQGPVTLEQLLVRARAGIAERRGRNIATVAVARTLLTLVYYGLRDGHIRAPTQGRQEAA